LFLYYIFPYKAIPLFIGIGKHNPSGILDIDQGTSTNGILLYNHASGATFGSMMTQSFSRGTTLAPSAVSSTDRVGGLIFQAHDGTSYKPTASIEANVSGTVATGSIPSNISFFTTPVGGTARVARMVIDNSGDVGIGATSPAGYKLGVNGSVIATTVVVKLYANWPDYVLKPAYKLPALSQVKSYIDLNQHLPDVPSAADISKDGLNLGEMNKLLVKKVEELTLYLIDQSNQLEKQKEVNQSLQQQIDNQLAKQKEMTQALQEEINELQKAIKSVK